MTENFRGDAQPFARVAVTGSLGCIGAARAWEQAPSA